ncbi:MAG: acetyl-CoA carboxylase biotin carboxyl carrier protein [Bacteriovoracaceae bacterium]|jgi:acetyl-CoA carboxylase biotin carboxyl carrier protein|nr:acetyl-CoA carboxylase biotin carboxyl carrier protein [Bacteriovoracaceae bacterium]
MSFKKLKEFISLAKEEGVCSLKYKGKDEEFEVEFSTGVAQTVVHSPVSSTTTTASVEKPAIASTNSDYYEVKSPFVGTFYSSPSPEEDAYVKVGDKVTNGVVLCILEAMKIMNEIESEFSGEIAEICVENESLVEYGQTLFKIKK